MPKNEILLTLVALVSAVLLISFWGQLLTIVLFGVVVVFCNGLYSEVAVVQH
jgi:hypothetical protein